MHRFLLVGILIARIHTPAPVPAPTPAPTPTPSPFEIRLSIAPDPYTSSDTVTICRVRAVNGGSRTWSGKRLRFEARAVDVSPAVCQRGRFGLELPPYGSLETLIALPGRHTRLEVVWIATKTGDDTHPRARSTRHKKGRRPH